MALVVADSSVIVDALVRLDDEGNRVRRWLAELANGDPLHIFRSFTHLEVISALRRLAQQGKTSEREAERAIKRFIDPPVRRLHVTQPMAVRIRELCHNLTASDAAYVALVERLQSEHRAPALLATADVRLANAPGLACEIHLFA